MTTSQEGQLAGSTPEEHRDRQGRPAAEQTGGKECQIRCAMAQLHECQLACQLPKLRLFLHCRPVPPSHELHKTCGSVDHCAQSIGRVAGKKKKKPLTSNALFNFGMDDCLTNSTCARYVRKQISSGNAVRKSPLPFCPRLKRPVGLENQHRSAKPSPALAQPDPNTTQKQTKAKQINSTPIQ